MSCSCAVLQCLQIFCHLENGTLTQKLSDMQARIAEYIRQKNVEENFESAMEFNPEVFAQVTMLYVNMDVGTSPFLDLARSCTELQFLYVKHTMPSTEEICLIGRPFLVVKPLQLTSMPCSNGINLQHRRELLASVWSTLLVLLASRTSLIMITSNAVCGLAGQCVQ